MASKRNRNIGIAIGITILLYIIFMIAGLFNFNLLLDLNGFYDISNFWYILSTGIIVSATASIAIILSLKEKNNIIINAIIGTAGFTLLEFFLHFLFPRFRQVPLAYTPLKALYVFPILLLLLKFIRKKSKRSGKKVPINWLISIITVNLIEDRFYWFYLPSQTNPITLQVNTALFIAILIIHFTTLWMSLLIVPAIERLLHH